MQLNRVFQRIFTITYHIDGDDVAVVVVVAAVAKIRIIRMVKVLVIVIIIVIIATSKLSKLMMPPANAPKNNTSIIFAW